MMEEEKIQENDKTDRNEDTRGWSKLRFIGYILLATFGILITSHILADIFSQPYLYYEFFIGFLLVFVPLGYSVVGIRYSKAKYGKHLWNTKTWIPAAGLVINIVILISFFLVLMLGGIRYDGDVIFFLFAFIFLINLGGFSWAIAYGIGHWGERKQILKEIRGWGRKVITIEELAYHFGIKKEYVIKQLDKLLSKNKLNGSLEKDRGLFIQKGLKDDIVYYIRDRRDETEIPLKDISLSFQIPESVASDMLQELMYERNLMGEINQLKGVYRLDKDTSGNRFDASSRSKTVRPIPKKEKSLASKEGFDARDMTYGDIKSKVSELKDEEPMIDTREVENALQKSELYKARKGLKYLVEKYSEYKEILKDLKQLDQRKTALAEQLADEKIDRGTYQDAAESIKHKKADLEESLNRMREKVIYEDYQKPF